MIILSKYTKEQLKHKLNDDSEEEHRRLREIFSEIKVRVMGKTQISIAETEFFCTSVKMLQTEGGVRDYCACDDWRFKWLYYRYWHDLDGLGDHKFPKGGKYIQPSRSEIEIELDELQLFGEEWYTVIQDSKISLGGLKEAAKETRDELKQLDKEPIFNTFGFLVRNLKYDRWRWAILIRLKYSYLLNEEIFETYGKEEVEFKLNGQVLVFTKYAGLHIINRHYARAQKVINLGKSFHSETIPPRKLITLVEKFIDWIESSGLYRCDNIFKIFFNYREMDFALWSEVQYKQKKGFKGNIAYNRIQTLYPIELHQDTNDLATNYSQHKLNEEFSIYLKNKV
jgi:hypothetical protein